MALTPEDVVNKRFQPTKFREGYDQDEVDDFLDEVVVELRRLNQENDELKQRVAASDARIAELQRAGGSVSAPESSAPEQVSAPEPEPAPAPTPEPVPAPAPAAAAPSYVDESQSTNNLLQLARRLHEEHVKEGAEKRDALIAEGHATAARIVAEAESHQRQQLATLEQERSSVEHRIEELRTFEREYRHQLHAYIEGQLHDLDASSVSSASSGSSAPASAPTPVSSSDAAAESTPAPQSSFQGFGA